jgi:hypothetical protein
MLGALAMGAKGAVGSGFNFAAPIYNRLLAAFQRGDLAAAREEQFRGVRIIQIFAGLGYMGAAKAAMKMLGVDVGPARLPRRSGQARKGPACRAYVGRNSSRTRARAAPTCAVVRQASKFRSGQTTTDEAICLTTGARARWTNHATVDSVYVMFSLKFVFVSSSWSF